MAGVGNKVKLKDGRVGVIQKVTNGNFMILTAEGTHCWITPSDIEEVLNV